MHLSVRLSLSLTPRLQLPYPMAMNAELATLEHSVNLLLERHQRLQEENSGLRRELEAARRENARLAGRIASTADRLETLLERLPEE